jgi:sec-independent protein translocase protein TatC
VALMLFKRSLPAGVDPQDAEEGRMPFLAHLGELRQRIIVTLIALGLGFIASFNFSDRIITWLARPLPVKLAFLEPTEPFWVNMKVAMVAGLFLVLPVVLYEIWAFIAPGLLPHERKFAAPFVILSTLFFFMGAAFALTVIVPFAVKFLVGYKTENLVATISVNRYVDFVLKFTLAFGLVFEMPLAITLGARLGLVTPEFLSKNRKYAILVNFVIAAILTPTPDAFNQLLMAGPLCILYELGIIAARLFGRPKPAVAA